MKFIFIFILLICFYPFELKGQDTNAAKNYSSKNGKIIITKEQIVKMQVNSITELLNQIPGITATSKGIKFRGSSSKHILVLLDGRNLVDRSSSHSAVNWEQISVNSISKIEILKGSGSVLHGDNSSGGVISISTRNEKKGKQINLSALYGRFDTQKYNLTYKHSLNNFGFSIYPGYKSSDGFRKNSKKNTKRISGRINYNFNRKTNIVLISSYSEEERRNSGPLYRPTPNAESSSRNLGTSLIISALGLKSKTHFNSFKNTYDNPIKNISNRLENQSIKEDLSASLSLKYLGEFSLGTSLEYAFLNGNKINGTKKENKYSFFFIKDFLLEQIKLGVNFGLRFNFYSHFTSAINPQLQLQYNFEQSNITFSFGTASNIPNYYKRFFGSTIIKANPKLKMEKAVNLSLRFGHSFSKNFESEVSFFMSNLKNYISRTILPEYTTYENIGTAGKKGFEIVSKININQFGEINTSYTYLIAKDKSKDKFLPFSPKYKIDLNYNIKIIQSLTLKLNSKYMSQRFANSENTKALKGDYIAVDLKLDYSPSKNWLLKFNIENLLNKYYEWSYGYPYAPREWIIGVDFNLTY